MARIFNGNVANFFRATGLPYNLPTNCTIVWRAKVSSDAANASVLGRRGSDAGSGFVVRRLNGTDAIGITTFGNADISSNSNAWPADGAAHAFILTKSSNTYTFYADDGAVAKGSGSGGYTTGSNDGDLLVGAWGDYPVGVLDVRDPFNGSLWDVAVFPAVLTESQRVAYMGGTLPGSLGVSATHIWLMDNAAAGNESDTAGSATLTENGTVGYEATGGPTGPTINTQPSNASVTAPATASFSVSATASAGSLTYQWQVSTNSGSSWANVSDGTGATSASYTTSATAVSTGNHRNGYQYRCAVTDSNGTVNSNAATLTVAAAALSVTLDALVDESGDPRAAYLVDKIWAIRVSDNTLVATWTAQTTNGSGALPALSNAGLTAVPHEFVTYTATGLRSGAKVYTPA